MGPLAESRPIRVVSLWNWREHTKCSPILLQDSIERVTKWQREKSCVHKQNCEEERKRLILSKTMITHGIEENKVVIRILGDLRQISSP